MSDIRKQITMIKQAIGLLQSVIADIEERLPVDTPEKQSRFVPPTFDQVQAHIDEHALQVDPQKFMNHYQTNGWKAGKNPMKDWQAALRTWDYGNRDSYRDRLTSDKLGADGKPIRMNGQERLL